jgi:hypothetical protein
LTSFHSRLKYPTIALDLRGFCKWTYALVPPVKRTYDDPQSKAMANPCRHPRVQVVSRDEDAEYVECLECREVFDSSEFRDMDIEEKIPAEEE